MLYLNNSLKIHSQMLILSGAPDLQCGDMVWDSSSVMFVHVVLEVILPLKHGVVFVINVTTASRCS